MLWHELFPLRRRIAGLKSLTEHNQKNKNNNIKFIQFFYKIFNFNKDKQYIITEHWGGFLQIVLIN